MEQREAGDLPQNKKPASIPARQLDLTAFTGGHAASSTEMLQKPQGTETSQMMFTTMPKPTVPPSQSSTRFLLEPESWPRQNVTDVADGTPMKQMKCYCQYSRSLNLDCECFISGVYCDGCNCANCRNNVDTEAARREVSRDILEHNPAAFRPEIEQSTWSSRNAAITRAIGSSGYGSTIKDLMLHLGPSEQEKTGEVLVSGKHNNGSNCKNCLRRNCQCIQANAGSSGYGSTMIDLTLRLGQPEQEKSGQVLVSGKHKKGCKCKKSGCLKWKCQCAHAEVFCSENCKCMNCKNYEGSAKRQVLFPKNIAANATTKGAKESSGYGSTMTDLTLCLGQSEQVNQIEASVSSPLLPSIPGAGPSKSMVTNPEMISYSLQSSLAGIIQPKDPIELSRNLVNYSEETAKKHAVHKSAKESGSDVSRGRPMSPGPAASSNEQESALLRLQRRRRLAPVFQVKMHRRCKRKT